MAPCCWLLLFFLMRETGSRLVENSTASILNYLQKFGYVRSGPKSHENNLVEIVHDAVTSYQKSVGLEVTGIVEGKTLELMNSPRCGVIDLKVTRGKRNADEVNEDEYEDQDLWDKFDLTYRVYQYTEDLEIWQIDDMIDRAFALWTKNSNFTFIRSDTVPVDIELGFVDVDHGDEYPFPVPELSLAHAFPPVRGDIHFNEFINWTVGPREEMWMGVDIYQVLVHEIGHALGLSHSNNPSTIMYPFYKATDDPLYFEEEDIQQLQKLYSTEKKKSEEGANKKKKRPRADICNVHSYDAVTTDSDGSTYVFKDYYYWKLINGTDRLAKGYPRYISDDWANISYVDAAVSLKNGYLFLFQGEKYWRFENRKPSKNFPRRISKAFHLPESLETAFIWVGDHKTYFFKDDKAWSLHHGRIRRANRSQWKGLPKRIDAAFRWFDDRTYFFSGLDYYRFDESEFQLEEGYPRLIVVDWFGCYKDDFLQGTKHAIPHY